MKLFKIRKKIWAPVIVRVFENIKGIIDPEFPFSLISLKILFIENVFLYLFGFSQTYLIKITFCPTSLACSLTPIIGLSIRNILFHKEFQSGFKKSIPFNWLGDFTLNLPIFFSLKGEEIGKQLNDQERVSAALENLEIRKTILCCFKK